MKIHKTRLITELVIVLIMVNSACQPILTTQSTGQPTRQLTDEEASDQTISEILPEIIEVNPPVGSTIGVQQHFNIIFNQPMDQVSVVKGLTITPSIDYTANWTDKQSLELTLDEPLPVNKDFSISFSKLVRSITGLSSGNEFVLNYQTSDALRIIDFSPYSNKTDVNPSDAVMISFNQPMADPVNPSYPQAFELDPAAEGKGEWLNSATYVFYPQPQLLGDTTYIVKINQELISRLGTALEIAEEQSTEWTFQTITPKLESVEVVDPYTRPYGEEPSPSDPIVLDASFLLSFNQTMDAESVQDHFSFKDGVGITVSGSFEWNEKITELTFTPDELLARDTTYTLQVDADAAAWGGVSIGKAVSEEYKTVRDLEVVEIYPSSEEPGWTLNRYTGISITFNAPINSDDLEKSFTLKPVMTDVNIYMWDDYTINIQGYIKGDTSYTLTIFDSFSDIWGQKLGNSIQHTFSYASIDPELVFPLQWNGIYTVFATTQDTSALLQATNVNSLNIELKKISFENMFKQSSTNNSAKNNHSDINQNFQYELNLPPEITTLVEVPFSEDEKPLPTGWYSYNIGTSEAYPPSPAALIVSDYSIMLKRSDQAILAWVVNLLNGKPVESFSLDLYHIGAESLDHCVTDSNGLCTFDQIQEISKSEEYFAVHGQPGDNDFALGYNRWEDVVDQSGYTYNNGTTSYLYTDRQVYEPGDVVNYRIITRDKQNLDYSIPDIQELQLEYGMSVERSSEKNMLQKIPVTISEFGSGTGSFTLPEYAQDGKYYLSCSDVCNAYTYFEVIKSQKEVELQVSFNKSDIVSGENLIATVKSTYNFGTPAANIPLYWTFYEISDYLELPDGFITGDETIPWGKDIWDSMYEDGYGNAVYGYSRTGEDGTVEIEIPFPISESDLSGRFLDLTLAVSITDEDMDIYDDVETDPTNISQASVYIHPEAYYIGIRSEQMNGTAGSPMKFSIETVDPQKNPFSKINLTANLKKVNWISKKSVTGFPESVPVYTTTSSVDFVTDENGEALIELTPLEAGTYILEIQGGKTSSQLLLYVGGDNISSTSIEENQEITILKDKDKYQSGDTANLFIPNPFDKAIALITIERNEIMQSFVKEIEDAQLNFSFNIKDEYAPNVYVSVTLVKSGCSNGCDFQQGYISIPVEPQQYTLTVDIQATPEIVKPGEDVLIQITAKDPQGNLVQGEFSLSVVDQALLPSTQSNSGNIVSEFYGTQHLKIQSSFSLAGYALRKFREYHESGDGMGGDYVPTLYHEQDFNGTVYWNGSIITDANGQAEVTVTLPDVEGTWVAIARGITKDTLVGEASTEIVASSPLRIEPITPEFVVVGDHIQMAALVHNNTTDELTVDVSLQAAGFTLDENIEELQQVEINAGETQRVTWWGKVENAENINLTYTAKSGEYQDSVSPKENGIPILKYSSTEESSDQETSRTVEAVQAVNKGISIERYYTLWSEDCISAPCPAISQFSLSKTDVPVIGHLIISITEDMDSVIVEDWLPSGVEVIDPSQIIQQTLIDLPKDSVMESLNSDVSTWASSYFDDPTIFLDHVRWVAAWLPAGTYELTYKFTPYLAGEYRVLPARAWQYYFPEVEGATAGEIFTIGE